MDSEANLKELARVAILAADLPLLPGDDASQSFALYFDDSAPKGLRRMLLGILPLLPQNSNFWEILETISASPHAGMFDNTLKKQHPVGFVLARNPCVNLDALPAIWSNRKPDGKWHGIEWNPVHLDMAPETLYMVHATCLANGITGLRTIKADSVLQRILDQHRHLVSGGYSNDLQLGNPAEQLACTGDSISEGFSQKRLLALRNLQGLELETRSTTIFERIPGNWWSPSVATRSASQTTLLTQLREISERLRKYLFFTESGGSRSSMEPGKLSEKAIQNSAKIPSLSRLSEPGHPCHPEILHLLHRASAELDHPGAAAVALLITAAAKPWETLLEDIVITPHGAVLNRPVKLWQDSISVDGTIHRPVEPRLATFTTRDIGMWTQKHLTLPTRELQARSEQWMSENSRGISLSALCSSLTFNWPLWADMPAIYYGLGLSPLAENRSGWMHYVHYDPAQWEGPVLKLLTSIDPGYRFPESALPRTGSALCPNTECLQSLFEAVFMICSAPIPRDADTLISSANVIAAGARLCEALLTFTRNFDDFKPILLIPRLQLEHRNAICLIREKSFPRTIAYTQTLRKILLRFHQHLANMMTAISRQGFKLESDGSIYWFVSRVEDKLLRNAPTHRAVSNSLGAHPLTERFEFLHRRAMRNFSNTVLREDRVLPENAIQAIHDHFPNRAKSPHSPDSLRSSVMVEEREIAAFHLAKKVNLEWALK